MTTTVSVRYNTCELCKGSIVNRGQGWYHTGPGNGHYARPTVSKR